MNNLPSIPYRLRYSVKAKYLQLRITPLGLEVVVPSKKPASVERINQFISQKYEWIQKKLAHVALHEKMQTVALPTQIEFPALQQQWEVFYRAINQRCVTVKATGLQQLWVEGPISDEKRCLRALQNWLIKEATPPLTARLKLLSEQTALSFKAVLIKNHKTRWGSCSNSGHINLCCKLLFLPPHLVDHVLLHELCHTQCMHHGKLFWQKLGRFDRLAREHAKELKREAMRVPGWAKVKLKKAFIK